MSASDNKAMVRRLYENGFPPNGNEFISPDYEPSLTVVIVPYAREEVVLSGLPAWDLERDRYNEVLYDLRWEVLEMVAERDVVLALIDVHGTPDHALPESLRVVGMHKLKGGRLTGIWHYWMVERPFHETLKIRSDRG